jgi:ATP-dependent DNA helicase RecQ
MTTETTTNSEILATLKSTFGYSSFRPLQEEIVRATLDRRDVFVLMPTGGGKSLCYQLPALLHEGTTVVVSPLIALMKDQVDALRALGVSATFINSSLDPPEISRRQEALTRGEVKLLYVAPERLMLPGFLRLLSSIPIAGFVIDEAHCISEWGHDFRPEYRDLRRLRSIFPKVPLGAYTATATTRVQADIRSQLDLGNAAAFQASFNRPNLFYQVRPKDSKAYGEIAAYVRAHPEASGIIYCTSRASTETIAGRLKKDGFRAIAYHAGLESDDRLRRQEAFVRDDVQIIVATVAFGMGIDKPDVRFVIHHDLPKSLEGYYQESGRAGRDGEPSDCILFYNYADVAKQRHFIADKETEEERRVAEWQLKQMTDWASGSDCRRRTLLGYFDEQFEGQEDPCCDLCRSPLEREDATVPAQMFLSCVKRTGERFGVTYIIQVLRGSRDQRILGFGHDRLSTYGIGKDRTEDDWRHISRELIRGEYLFQDQEAYNALKVTESGRRVLLAGEKVSIVRPQRPSRTSKSKIDEDTPNPVLFERLRVLRKRLADERRVPPYVIFHDGALKHMAASLPRTRDQLLRVPGVGERKVLDFGEVFLAEIAAHVGQTGDTPVTMAPRPITPPKDKDDLGATVLTTLELLSAGNSIQAIARERGLNQNTIENHLVEAIQAGEAVDVDRLIDAAKRQAIERTIEQVGDEYLSPVMERLGAGYTYGELRLVKAWRRRERASRR